MRKIGFLIMATCLLMAAVSSCNSGDSVKTAVESVSLDKYSVYAFVGDKIQLNALLYPAGASRDGLEWSSSDESVATVDSTGLVSVLAEGDASIYVVCEGQYASCDVASTAVELGQYYCSDGTLSDTYDPQKSIALVFRVGHHPNDVSDYSGSGIGMKECHGYAVALHDAVDQWCVWGPYDILGCYPQDEDGNARDNFTGNTSDTDWSGYLYTTKLKEATDALESFDPNDNMDGYSAYWHAVDYEQTVPAPAMSSGWFLPAGSQIWCIWENIDLLNRVDEHRLVQNEWYWSSSEFWEIPEQGANFLNSQTGRIEGFDKTGGCLVRSIIAF